ncbi:serine hydrolase [Pedobacter sp. L105]|uniref:serine hydrolase domain-containing protein n=1 Tax=Pedobacter sp. L105 TaxID=1641871 RepID=UPI00131C069C|nr:serine hydrolase [Pedobacter sp. L105]
MKKALYTVVLLCLLVVLIFAMLFTWRPELIRVVRYQIPDAATYKAYPQTVVLPSDTAFHFSQAPQNRNDLDTLHVLDGKNHLVPFKDYLLEGKINLFMVIRNDSIIYQKYAPGYSDTTLTTLFSVAKTMVSIVLGQALEEGKIKSLNDHVTQYVPELKANPAFKDITLMNLLSMKSGLKFEDTNGSYLHAFLSDEARFYYTDDIKKQLLNVTLDNKPGTVYKYESIDAFLLTWALENATGKKVSAYFQDKVWKRIGTEYKASWGLDHQNGLANTASRFQCTAIDLAKIGRLYLNNGKYNGQQIVPQEWVNRSLHLDGEIPATAKGWQKTAHHYLWWIPQQGVNGDFAAEGMLGQRLYMDPLTHTIIVQFADKGAGDYPYRKISRYLSGLPFAYPR